MNALFKLFALTAKFVGLNSYFDVLQYMDGNKAKITLLRCERRVSEGNPVCVQGIVKTS